MWAARCRGELVRDLEIDSREVEANRNKRRNHRESFQTMSNSLDLWAFDILAECSYYADFVCKQGDEKQLAA